MLYSYLLIIVSASCNPADPNYNWDYDLCTSGRWGDQVSLQINMKLYVKSSDALSVNMEPLYEEEEIYAARVETLTTGSSHAKYTEKKFVLFNYNPGQEVLASFTLFNNSLQVHNQLPDTYIVEWPVEEDYPDKKSLLAIKNSIRGTPTVYEAVARGNGSLP